MDTNDIIDAIDVITDEQLADLLRTRDIQQVIAEETSRHGYRKPNHHDDCPPSEWDLGRYVAAFMLPLMLLTGCASVRHVSYSLTVKPNGCQVTETRPSMFSTATATVCWDSNGQAIGFSGQSGQPTITVPLSILSAGAMVGSAGVISYGIIKGTQNLQSITGNVTHSGTVNLESNQVNGYPAPYIQ